MKMREPHRLNVRLSADLNDWLNRESKETGISKTATIAFATEQYRQQKETSVSLPKMIEKLNLKG